MHLKQLYVKDLKISRLYIILFALFILLTYLFHVNSMGINMTVILGFLILLFYFDYQHHVLRSLVSMPLNRKQIVRTRYVFLYSLTIVFMLFIWLVDSIAINNLYLGNFTYLTAKDIVHYFVIVTVLLAIYLPIFYLIKNFMHAVSVFMVSHFVIVFTYSISRGNPYITLDDKIASLIEALWNIQPFVIPLVVSLLVMFVSYLISNWFFIKFDLE